MLIRAVFLISLGVTGYIKAASDTLPVEGVWYVPDEPGSGVNISYQHGVLLAIIYTYDPESTQATFYIGSGDYVPGGVSRLSLISTGEGSCVWCTPYESYTVQDEEAAIIEFEFEGTARGLLRVGELPEKRIRYFEFNSREPNLRHGPDDYGPVFVPDLSGDWVFASEDRTFLRQVRFAGPFPIIDPSLEAGFLGPITDPYMVCRDPDFSAPFDKVICTLFSGFSDIAEMDRPLADFRIEDVTTTKMVGELVDADGVPTGEMVRGLRTSWDRGID